MRTEISENHDQYYDISICTVTQIAYYLGKYLLNVINGIKYLYDALRAKNDLFWEVNRP